MSFTITISTCPMNTHRFAVLYISEYSLKIWSGCVNVIIRPTSEMLGRATASIIWQRIARKLHPICQALSIPTDAPIRASAPVDNRTVYRFELHRMIHHTTLTQTHAGPNKTRCKYTAFNSIIHVFVLSYRNTHLQILPTSILC